MKVLSVVLSVFLGLGLVLVFSFLAQTGAGAAPEVPSVIRYVRPSGGAGFFTTIQAAVDASASGDTILVAEGVYHEAVLVTKSLTLQGGWNTDFTAWNWTVYHTTIDADGAGSAIRIDGDSAPIQATIEGFYITDGDASNYLGWGGGILAQGEWNNPGLITIRNNYISNNVACRLDGCQGYGGGVVIYSNHAVIENNVIVGNIARADGAGSGQGGGVAIWGWPTDATLYHNVIEYNTAVISTTGEFSAGEGGGVWCEGSGDVVLEENWIRQNTAVEKGKGWGGGVYSTGLMYRNEIISNTASVDGVGYGGGVYAYYTPNFHDNLVQGNIASKNAAGSGGGIYALYLRDAHGNTIWNNKATDGGGVYFSEYLGQQKFYDNLVARNSASGLDTTIPQGGGGILNEANWVEITSNQILTNTGLAGGGVLMRAGERIRLEGNLIRANLSYAGGGLYMNNTNGQVLKNRLASNGALWWGGGLYLAGNSSPQLDRNAVYLNTAGGYSGFAAGGIAIGVDASTHVTLTNTLVAYNTINSGVASGVHCFSGSCSLIHCTIVDNKYGANPGEGVRIGALGGENVIWNSIIVGHSVGVVIGGTPLVSLDYNSFYDNDLDTSGVSPGAHSLFVSPLFVNRWAGDYHLSQFSPLINAGDSNLSIGHDFEGDVRILGPDIGADDFVWGRIYLPRLYKDYVSIPRD